MILVLSTSSRSDAKCGYVMTCDLSWWLIPKRPSEDCTPTSSPGRFSLAFGKKAREKRPGDEVAHSPTLYARGFKGT